MRVIKRYPNRKLYDTEDKKYVTLSGIAELIRDGQEVQVVDHGSGEDLTTLTLTQIIFEQEKKQAGFLPKSVLTGLVQAGGERVSTLRRALTLPLELVRQVDEEIDRRVRALISHGELGEAEGMRLRDKLLAFSRQRSEKEMGELQEVTLAQLLGEHGVPTRGDLQKLEGQLALLEQKLDSLLENSEAQ